MTTINVSTGAVSAIPMGYGPKGEKGDTGPQGPAGPTGDTGPQGLTGAAGVDGADGKTVLNGSGAPSDSVGADGDFYIDTAANEIYGPKAAGAWPGSGVSLVGPKGDKGDTGDPGSTGIPAGAIMAFAMSTAPTGWSECDGGLLNRTTESGVFAAIGTTFGEGDGTTTFNKPDLRGEFIRGWAHGKAVANESARTFGSFQDSTKIPSAIAYGTGYIPRVAPSDADESSFSSGANTFSAFAIASSNSDGPFARVRPRNVALMYCIKL